jgi:hypothetical protein
MLSISDFNSGSDVRDTTPAARAAVQALRATQDRRLVLPAGRYDFWPDYACERYLFVSNNDEGLKRIAFDLSNLQDVEIDGQGSVLMFHGGIVPFVVEKCARVRLRNLTIDWARSFHNEARVLSADEAGVDLEIDEAFPFKIAHGRIKWLDETGKDTFADVGNILEFDSRRRETAFMARDNYGIGERYNAVSLGGRRVRFNADFQHPSPTPGNVLAIMAGQRHYPAFILSHSSEIELADVTVHHCGGMGVIAQRCADVLLRQVTVAPSQKRMVSATADATHFVNCSGHVQVVDCQFENQLDDPLNCHGVYGRVSGRTAIDTIDLKLIHGQQLGFELVSAGNTMEFVRQRCLSTYHEGVVKSVERLNRQVTRVTFDRPLPGDVADGDAATDITATCDLTVKRTSVRGNRARGFLVSTPGKVLIEENTLHTPGAAILIEGDANYWFESGAVRNVLVRNNLFDNCNYGVWGNAAIQITPGVSKEAPPEARYHRNIRIENNAFIAFDRRLLHARSVDGLSFVGNTVTASDQYPRQHEQAERFDVKRCSNVRIEDCIEVERRADGEKPSARRIAVSLGSGVTKPRIPVGNG